MENIMIMATISFGTIFQLSSSNIEFNDSSDYAGQSISTANVNGCFKITSPSGITIYNNADFSDANCDIWIDNALTSQQPMAPPLGTDGFPQPGVYTILYTVYNKITLTYYTVTKTYTYKYMQPIVSIIQTVDCISPLFTSVDATTYTVAGTAPSITRVHTIDYPYGSAGESTPVIGSAATLTTGTFYNGTQTTEISSDLEYTFPDGLQVTDTITGDKEILVNCTFICSIYCCIRSIEQQMLAAKGVNDVEYQNLKALFDQIMAFVGLSKLAIECGKSNDVNGYLDQIRTLSNCTSDCDCSSGTPSLVTGIGGLVNSVIVNSGGAPVVVTPATVGNTTTYSVSLDAAFIINANKTWVKLFSNDAARIANIPDFIGQLGVQIDTDTIYDANGLSAGNWIQDTFFKKGSGADSLMTKNATDAAGTKSIATGYSASSVGASSVALGFSALASGTAAIAIGQAANAGSTSSLAIGNNTVASAAQSVAIGGGHASNTEAIAIGNAALASQVDSISIGASSSASGNSATSLGVNSVSSDANAIAIGNLVSAIQNSAIVIGKSSDASGLRSIVIGSTSIATETDSISIGSISSAIAINSTALGNSSSAQGNNSIAAGQSASASGIGSSSFGLSANALGDNSLCMGSNSIATQNNAISIGHAAGCAAVDAIAIGNSSGSIGIGASAIGAATIADVDSATAIGHASEAHGLRSTAIGESAKTNRDDTVNIAGTIITRQDAGETPSQQFFSGAIVTITTAEVNLKTIADYTITLPSGTMFYPDEVDLIITNANTVTGQPTVRAGGDVSTASLLAAVGTTALTTTFQRQRFATLLTSIGQATLSAGVTVAATGTTIKGRFCFRGILIENE